MQNSEEIIHTILSGLTGPTREVFDKVSKLDCIKNLYLCGGTGQSVQMNHRLSEDLDFELIGLRKERPRLDMGSIIGEVKSIFPDAREEILGEDHVQIFINAGQVKLSFFRPRNPVKSIQTGIAYNNIKAPVLQELLGMKVFTLCVRTVFRDYYDIYCLLEEGCLLEEAISYASYLSRHEIRSKTMYSRLLSPFLFIKTDDFMRMSPIYNVTSTEICERIKTAMEFENLQQKSGLR